MGNFAEFREVSPGIFEAALLDRVVAEQARSKALALSAWSPATVSLPTGIRTISRNTRETQILSHKDSGDLVATLYKQAFVVGLEMCRGIAAAPLQLTAIQVLRYDTGQFYAPHTDVVKGAPHVRRFTILCYLNDDFAGGDTSFPIVGFSYRPRAGCVLMFPSALLHQSEPVSSGCKLVAVAWCTQ